MVITAFDVTIDHIANRKGFRVRKEDSIRYPAAAIRILRSQIAGAISNFSANEVPALCRRLGLREGDRDEAYRGKFTYTEGRLREKSAAELLQIARDLREEVDSYSLSEALAKVEDHGKAPITELTRRRIMAIFEKRPYSTEFEDIDFLRRVWPTGRMASVFENAPDEQTLDDDLFNAIVRHNDWNNREILEAVGYLTCSQNQFFKFLEEVTSPLTQSPDSQAELVAAINHHILHDGYRLFMVRKLSGSPVYEVHAAALGSPSDTTISETLAAFDTDTIHARWTQALDRRDGDPGGGRSRLPGPCLKISANG